MLFFSNRIDLNHFSDHVCAILIVFIVCRPGVRDVEEYEFTVEQVGNRLASIATHFSYTNHLTIANWFCLAGNMILSQKLKVLVIAF